MISHQNLGLEWNEVNDVLNGIYKTGKQIEFYTLMLKASLCNCD